MDGSGARALAARIRAGVKVGTTIVLDREELGSDLVVGDVGIVTEINHDGMVVAWERGFSRTIDPRVISFHTLA